MSRQTKPLSKIESLSQALFSKILPEGSRGIDIDFICRTSESWIVFEFLRCINTRPRESHPRRYWFKNWRKFVSLWKFARDLSGRLILVNYETKPFVLDGCQGCGQEVIAKEFGEFLVLEVDLSIVPSETSKLCTSQILVGGYFEFSQWVRDLNGQCVL